MKNETALLQRREAVGAPWQDYSRGTVAEVRKAIATRREPWLWRGVDWLDKSQVLVLMPDPCARCGWQYSMQELLEFALGWISLDLTPTHECNPTESPAEQ